MIVDKPDWVSHGGPIFSLDIHPEGVRFATGGEDHKVRIWGMGPVLSKKEEGDADVPKILATLVDHFGPVNVVRWSRDGRFIASGSDDKIIIITELRPGGGQATFGSTDTPNVENWKALHSLRSHKSNVTDVAWSVGDAMIASCSVDNEVIIWDPATEQPIVKLRGHTGMVKGVSWDPVGNYLVSQSDDKSVIIWKVDGWSMVRRVTGPYTKSVGATFFLRLCWTPDGSGVVTTNSYGEGSHTAAVLSRGEWERTNDFVGHKGPVLVGRFNPRPFRGEKGALCFLVALGSQDNTITVWSTASPRPLVVLKSFFASSVVDLAWTPDGRTLLAASLDGSVARFTLEGAELGAEMATEEEFERHMRKVYGDLRGRNTTIAESVDQLALEAAAGAGAGAKAGAGAGGRVAAIMMGGSVGVSGHAHAGAGAAAGGGGAAAGAGAPSPGAPQQEFRRADGRRQIVPQAMGGDGGAPIPVVGGGGAGAAPVVGNGVPVVGNGAGALVVAGAAGAPGSAKRRLGMGTPPHIPAPKRSAQPLAPPAAAAGRGAASPPALAAGSAAAARGAYALIPVPTVMTELVVDAGPSDALAGEDGGGGARAPRDSWEAVNTAARGCSLTRRAGGGAGAGVEAGSWSDRLPSPAVALAGTPRFSAAALRDGTLQVYSRCGRRLLPALVLDSPACFLASDGEWKLLAATAHASLQVWDLGRLESVLEASLAPVLASAPPGVALAAARISRSGHPLAVLSNGYAFMYQGGLKAWLRVADNAFAGSEFSTTLPPPAGAPGELAQLTSSAARARGGGSLGAALVTATAREREEQTARHLEALLASSRALGSPAEWSQWLGAYARHLTATADEGRLRELCLDLLGPVAPQREPAAGDLAAAGGGAAGRGGRWDPEVLGVKKRELLRGVVLPSMARNRAVQRLTNEVLEMVAEAEGAT